MRSQAAWPRPGSVNRKGPIGCTRRPSGTSSSVTPEAGASPPATVSRTWGSSAGPDRATRTGERCTASGRFPAGAGPLPCSQYLVNTGWAGSWLAVPRPAVPQLAATVLAVTGRAAAVLAATVLPASVLTAVSAAAVSAGSVSARVRVPADGTSAMAAPPSTGSGLPSVASHRSVTTAALMPPARRSSTRAGAPAAVRRPPASRSLTVTPSARCGSPGRPEASGLPRGFSAASIAGGPAAAGAPAGGASTPGPEAGNPDTGNTEQRLATAAAGPLCRSVSQVSRSWLYSWPAAGKPASRQSPGPAASAYSKVWLDRKSTT